MFDFLTRREKHILIALIFIWGFTMVVPQQILDDYEILFYLVFLIPLAIYLLGDKERYPRDQE